MKSVYLAVLAGFLGVAAASAVVHADQASDADELAQYERLVEAARNPQAAPRAGGACAQGLEAFRKTVQPFVRQNCIKCHNSPAEIQQGPIFASGDAAVNYADILKRMNFSNLQASRFVQKGGSHHCLTDWQYECGISLPSQVLPVVQAWWDQGQSQCADAGRLFSAPIALPENLPPRGDRFVKVRFDLATLGSNYAGVELQVEIQKFAEPSADYPGAYRIRKPRLVTPRRHLHIAGLRILVNGLWDSLADRFTSIDRDVGTQPMGNGALDGDQFPALASDALIMLQDRAAGDKLSVSFDKLDMLVDPPTCAAMPLFKSQVYPVMQTRACFHCHGTSGVDPRAKAVLDLSGPVEAVCARALERSDLALPTASPWVAFPFRGVFGHPRVIPTASEVFPAWSQWMMQERSAR